MRRIAWLAGYAFSCGLGLSQGSTLQICLVDGTNVPAADLQRASSIARTIFRRAGIETEWLACSEAHQEGRVVVRILGAGMVDPDLPGHILGTTNRAQHTVYVFYSRIHRSTLGKLGNEQALLGSVMAHEAGHLLGLEHSRSGLMRANLESRDVERARLGGLTFTADEAKRLKAEIVSRGE